ncbi:hypothetical protein L207DRAFT_571990 [Hyaloscypha variabilis F]|uniref:NAD(P)-binding protein n=1 Tax=Hyaloscypha variabilis (strain UAMH 11265 / GT02V1 / F) TaxID=1149755 RepID=A0A2J6R2J2_HYAVF|nr:hypothetical protein L207DRAFT_571990 [Hyaloscypha variabilis F]
MHFAIVTSTASKTGAAICRESLNSNASVLGIDTVPLQEESSFLKESSSFLFIEYGPHAVPSGAEFATAAKEQFKTDRIDWLINVIDEKHDPEENAQPVGQLLSVMEGKRTGLALNVVGGGVDQGALQETMFIAQTDEDFTRLKESCVRCNLLVPHDLEAAGGNDEDSWPGVEAKTAMQKHIERFNVKGYSVRNCIDNNVQTDAQKTDEQRRRCGRKLG